MWHCLYWASDNSCQLCSVQLAYKADAMWFEAICACWEGTRERAVILTGRLWNYLMNKYELYLNFSIIIILPLPDRYWDGAAACHVKTFMARSSSAWDLPFFKPPIKRPKAIIG